MSTPNFRTQRDFDLYCFDGSATEEQIKEYREMFSNRRTNQRIQRNE